MYLAMTRRIRDAAIALFHAAECAIHRVKLIGFGKRSDISRTAGRAEILHALSNSLSGNPRLKHITTALVFELDHYRGLEETHDTQELEKLLRHVSERLRPLLRENDIFAHLEGPRFAIALSHYRRLDLEAAIQLATRIQHALAEPFQVDRLSTYVTASIGFALALRLNDPTPHAILRAACIAQLEASRDGPNAIRSYSAAMHDRVASRDGLLGEVHNALAQGQITAFFQPQMRLSTQEVNGFEALARWNHPQKGLIPPLDFLPILEQAGLMRQLGQKILSDSLVALAAWDKQGLLVPHISVNLSNAELRNPNLVDHIAMELDRCGLSANRLVLEVLETVVSTNAGNIIEKNLNRLAKMGCGIDLDDFGTGHASITSIRKFAIQRIKIDRSFITHIDSDDEQRSMVAAILTMADRLCLDTLAEGVETPGEQLTLTQLGCGHMQGFLLSKPMDGEATTNWLQNRRNPDGGNVRQLYTA